MHKKPATIADVARLSGKSSATISRYINKTGHVSPEAAQAIQQIIDELGYVPSASARGLATRHTGMIGLVLPAHGNSAHHTGFDHENTVYVDSPAVAGLPFEGCASYLNEIIRGAEYAAWELGRAITISVARGQNTADRVRDMAGRVDGMVVVADSLSDSLLAHVASRVPVVSIAGAPHPNISDYVHAANAHGISLLVEHMVNDHHISDVRFIAGREGAHDDRQRFQGFQAALAKAGLTVPAIPEYRADFEFDNARDIALEIARTLDWGPDAPQRAFICSNDATAVGILEVFAALSINVPEQAVITGFDDCHIARGANPRISSVKQATAEMGALAVEALERRIADPTIEPQCIESAVKVLVRESCGEHN